MIKKMKHQKKTPYEIKKWDLRKAISKVVSNQNFEGLHGFIEVLSYSKMHDLKFQHQLIELKEQIGLVEILCDDSPDYITEMILLNTMIETIF